MKKILTFVLAVCMIIPVTLGLTACGEKPPVADAWDGTAAEVSAAVDGVITIDSAEELAGLAEDVNAGTNFEGVTIKLTTDIDLQNKEWTPIGYGSTNGYGVLDAGYTFKGTFDGQDHIVSNLKVTTYVGGSATNNTAKTGLGLFGSIYNATIKNITVDTATVSGNHFVGAVVGFASGSEIDNAHAKNATISCTFLDSDESGDKAGALIGFMSNSATQNGVVKNSSAEASTVNADRDAGQLIGCLSLNNYGTETTVSQTGNTVENVTVTWNESGSTPSKSGTNIKNELVGRE